MDRQEFTSVVERNSDASSSTSGQPVVENAFPGNAVGDVGKDAATSSSEPSRVDDGAGKFLEHFFFIQN